MKKLWLIILVIALICAALFALTFFVPDIRTFAEGLKKSNVPIWLVGLLAPILYAFKSLGGWRSKLFPISGEEKRIAEENEKIKKDLADIEAKVAGIVQWRDTELAAKLKEIDAIKDDIASKNESLKAIDAEIIRLKAMKPSEFSAGLSDEEVLAALDALAGVKKRRNL